MNDLLEQLRKPFHPSVITWKPGAVKGERALAMPYADLRAYMSRLDDVCPDWQVAYEPWGLDRIICRLTIAGITRSSTGETTNESEKSEIGGTVAEAQAFKRASAMFGLGRYLYQLPSGWADYDAKTRQFTPQAKAKLMGILTKHYREATGNKAPAVDPSTGEIEDGDVLFMPDTGPERATVDQLKQLHELGLAFYKAEWTTKLPKLVESVTTGTTNVAAQLSPAECERLIKGIENKMAAAVQSTNGEKGNV